MSRRFDSVIEEAAQSLLAHPLRSVLTVASVAFGMSALYVLLSYATGVPDTTASLLRALGSKEFSVEPRRSRGPGGSRGGREVRIRYADLPAIREACPSISGMAASNSAGFGGPVFSPSRSWPWARVSGVGYAYHEVTDTSIVEGRWFTQREEVEAREVALISKPLAEGMFDGRSPLGERLDARGHRFEIIGVFESNQSFAYSVLVPYSSSLSMVDGGGRYVSRLAFSPLRPDLARSSIAELRQALGNLYSFDPADERALDVTENTSFVGRVEATSTALQVLVLAIASLALILGCLGAANVVGIAVSERTAELGLRRALGATAARIRAEVVAETLLLAILGGLVGLAIGAGAVGILGPLEFSDSAHLIPEVDPRILWIAFPTLVIVATLAGLPAAGRAARVQPGVALRSE